MVEVAFFNFDNGDLAVFQIHGIKVYLGFKTLYLISLLFLSIIGGFLNLSVIDIV